MAVPPNYDTILDMAKLSCLVYSRLDTFAAKLGLRLMFTDLPDGFLKQDFSTTNYKKIRKWAYPQGEFDIALYEGINGATRGRWVLAVRGIEPTSPETVRDFLVMNYGRVHPVRHLLEIVHPLKAEADKKGLTLMFTGHSQGGCLADLCALATDCKAITFNAGGITPTMLAEAGLALEIVHTRKSNLTHVNVKGDWISDPWGNAPGTGGDTRLSFPFEGVPVPFFPALVSLKGPATQYGNEFIWLESIDANFLFTFPDWWSYGKFARAILNHSWDTFHWQLVNKKFLPAAPTRNPLTLSGKVLLTLYRTLFAGIRLILLMCIWWVELALSVCLAFISISWTVKQFLLSWCHKCR